MAPSRLDDLITFEKAQVAGLINHGSTIMNPEADKVFELAGLAKEGREELYRSVCHRLGARMAELSVRNGVGEMSWSERIQLFAEMQKELAEEIRGIA